MKPSLDIRRLFVAGSAVLLLLTGLAKLVSVTESARVLDTVDPIFTFLTTRQLLFTVAIVELAVGSVLFLRVVSLLVKLSLICWLASLFATYRLGLWYGNYKEPCKCLGGALDWIGLSDDVIRGISFGLFLILFIGGWSLVLLEYRRRLMRPAESGAATATVLDNVA